MVNQNRSIAYRLRKAQAMATKREILRDWLNSWDRETYELINDLGRAVARDDFDRQSQLVGELRETTRKRNQGLKSIFEILTAEKAGRKSK